MASFRLGLLPLLLATYPACILEASALVPQLVLWRKASLQLTPALPACPKGSGWVLGLPILNGKMLAGAPLPTLSLEWRW